MDHLIIIYLLLCGCGCGCGCWAFWGPSRAPRPRYTGPPLEIRPPVWKDPPTAPNPWLTFLCGYFALQVVIAVAVWITGDGSIFGPLLMSAVLVWIVRAKLRENAQLRIGSALVDINVVPSRAKGLMALGRKAPVHSAALERPSEAGHAAWARTG